MTLGLGKSSSRAGGQCVCRSMQATESEECVTLEGKSRLGAVQISAARKDDGQVTDSDLRQFAVEQRRRPPLPSKRSCCRHLLGFMRSGSNTTGSGGEWWLRSGGLMVYCQPTTSITAFKGMRIGGLGQHREQLTPLANSKDSTD